MQIDIDRRLRQKEAADASADEHRNETDAEKRRRSESHLRAVHGAYQQKRQDRRAITLLGVAPVAAPATPVAIHNPVTVDPFACFPNAYAA